jgi:hypothetical protein
MLLPCIGSSATTTADEEVSLMASAMGCGEGYGRKPTSVLSYLAARETRRSSAVLTLDSKTSVLSSIGYQSKTCRMGPED